MRAQMEMSPIIAVAVPVEMDALAPQAPQNVSAKRNEHSTNRGFQRKREPLGNGAYIPMSVVADRLKRSRSQPSRPSAGGQFR